MKTLLLLSVLLAATPRGYGALIANEDFLYSTGSISGRNGGSGFSSAYTGNGMVDAGSLGYVDALDVGLATSGNRVATNSSGFGMLRSLKTTGTPPGLIDSLGRFGETGSRIYLAFLIRLNSGDVSGAENYGGISLFAGTTEEMFFGDPGFASSHTFWGIDPQQGSGAVRDSLIPVDSAVHLLVARIDFGAVSETVRLYIDPTLNIEPATPAIAPFAVHSFDFDTIRIQGGGAGRYGIDEISLGTTWADVVPEPATTALMASAVFLASGFRWRDSVVAPSRKTRSN